LTEVKAFRLKALALLVVLATLSVGAVATPAEAATYKVGIGAFDTSRQRLSCNRGLKFDVSFGAIQYYGSERGIYVYGVQITNYIGSPVEITANFHNMGGHGGQGVRSLSNKKFYNNDTYYWAVNTPFWFAPGSRTFSSTVSGINFSCGGTFTDYILWNGPTHY
jgi:hypothetical protein